MSLTNTPGEETTWCSQQGKRCQISTVEIWWVNGTWSCIVIVMSLWCHCEVIVMLLWLQWLWQILTVSSWGVSGTDWPAIRILHCQSTQQPKQNSLCCCPWSGSKMEEFFSILGLAASDCLTNHKFWGRCRKQGMQRAGEGEIVLKAEKPRIAPKFAFSISQISSGIALQTKFPTWVPRNFLLLSFHNFSLQLFFLLWMGLYLLPRCICGQFYIYLKLFVHIHIILLLLSYWCLFSNAQASTKSELTLLFNWPIY